MPLSVTKLRRFASVSEAPAEQELAAEILSERSESKDLYSLVK